MGLGEERRQRVGVPTRAGGEEERKSTSGYALEFDRPHVGRVKTSGPGRTTYAPANVFWYYGPAAVKTTATHIREGIRNARRYHQAIST